MSSKVSNTLFFLSVAVIAVLLRFYPLEGVHISFKPSTKDCPTVTERAAPPPVILSPNVKTRILSYDPFIAHVSDFVSSAERESLMRLA